MNAKQKAQLHKITSKTLGKTAVVSENVSSLEALKEINVTVSVGFGSHEILIKDLLDLKQGDCLPLNKKVGDSLDIFVNNQLIGQGELTLTENGYGVVVTQILSE